MAASSDFPGTSHGPGEVSSAPGLSGFTEGDREEKADCALADLWVKVIITFFIVCPGFAGNCVSFAVMWSERHRSATVLLLLALAVVDNIVLLSWGSISALPTLLSYTENTAVLAKIYPYVVTYLWPFASLTHAMNTYMTVMLAIQRWILVCRPHDAKRYGSTSMARFQLLFVICFSIIFNISRFLEYYVVYGKDGSPSVRRSSIAVDPIYKVVYKTSLYYVFMYVIPVSILVMTSAQLVRSQRNSNVTKEKNKTRRELTRMLIVICLFFIVSQLFNPIRRIWEATNEENEYYCGTNYYYYSQAIGVAQLLNSSINFVIYMTFGQKFRQNVLGLCACAVRVAPENSAKFSLDRSSRTDT